MGTRNLTAVVHNNEYKIAQYGQWDGYPSGVGNDICNFIMKDFNKDRFIAALKECRFASEHEIEELLTNGGVDAHPQFSRDTGPDILLLVQDCGARSLHDSLSFAADSLFCEWAYIIDFDNNVLEIYRGFNKEPLKDVDRFSFLHVEDGASYYPVRLLKKIPFESITDSSMKDLEKELDH